MGSLKQFFEKNSENLIDKWDHYFDIYEFYFSKFKSRPINILEIGVFQGGSLLMWKDYFHKESKIYGIDFNPVCKQFESENIEIHIGSQSDIIFLKEFLSKVPPLDVIIDDGGHKMDQQILSFETLFKHLKPGGVYICEDTHTSYWKNYGGGLKKSSSFIEFSKDRIDDLHAWHSRNVSFKKNYFTENIKSVHFYDSMVVFLKDTIEPPVSKRTGKYVIDPGSLSEPVLNNSSFFFTLLNRIKRILKF